MPSYLLKTLLHKTIAEGLYKEILSASSKYYYFLGRTLSWTDEASPPFPIDSIQYERDTRNEIITLKEIKYTDLAFVIPRIDWEVDTVYDIYDDKYSTEVVGVNITAGGSAYASAPTITFSAPQGASGILATGTATVSSNKLIAVTMTNNGSGYTTAPTVTITGGGGSGAAAVGVIVKSPNNFQSIETANCFVINDEFNLYICLNNNNNSNSTVKPSGSQSIPFTLSDDYVWKFLYNIPVGLRTKFLTTAYAPISSALNEQFYSSGKIENVIIKNKGSGYTYANLSVVGDGYLERDPVYVIGATVSTAGTSYAATDTITFSSPVSTTNWSAVLTTYKGNYLLSGNDIYEVIIEGVTSSTAPSHRSGEVLNGTSTLKYIASRAKATLSLSSGGISAINLLGNVREITMSSFGSGYTSNPSISFTAPTRTFDSSTDVDVSTDRITLLSHWFSTGDAIVYSNGGGTSIGGLITNTTYYVIKISSTVIKLATSSANATAATAIDLTAGAVGSSHTISNYISSTSGIASLSSTGVVKKITITNSGENYPTAPTVTIGTAWPANTSVSLGAQYFISTRLYTVTTAGTTHASVGPTGTVLGTAYSNGTAYFTYVGTAATGSAVLRYGAGYTASPTMTITTSTGSGFVGVVSSIKTEAILLATIEDGQIYQIQVDDGGVGYTSATITVSGDGTLASVEADLNIGNINTPQANNELLVVGGTINNIKVISAGYSYSAATAQIIGDGTGATATVTISEGAISKITVTNAGSGYTYATVTITGNGYAGTARAIISSTYGHGKHILNDLFARTLMFYTNISNDTNQGFSINNDYRQVGLIKNPKQYNSTSNFIKANGSGCAVVGGTINTSLFTADMELTSPEVVNSVTYQRRYRIVSITSTNALIQILDNVMPVIGTVLTNSSAQSFVVSTVTNPTVDKYSGDLLFIDNKSGFTPSTEETIVLRTIIRF